MTRCLDLPPSVVNGRCWSALAASIELCVPLPRRPLGSSELSCQLGRSWQFWWPATLGRYAPFPDASGCALNEAARSASCLPDRVPTDRTFRAPHEAVDLRQCCQTVTTRALPGVPGLNCSEEMQDGLGCRFQGGQRKLTPLTAAALELLPGFVEVVGALL